MKNRTLIGNEIGFLETLDQFGFIILSRSLVSAYEINVKRKWLRKDNILLKVIRKVSLSRYLSNDEYKRGGPFFIAYVEDRDQTIISKLSTLTIAGFPEIAYVSGKKVTKLYPPYAYAHGPLIRVPYLILTIRTNLLLKLSGYLKGIGSLR